MTTFLNVTDRATTTLATTITSGGLSIVVNTGDGALFPSTNFIITIENERILIDSRSTDTLTVNASGRGYGGTSVASHTAGVAVQLRVVSNNITELQTAINARQLNANLTIDNTLGGVSPSDTLYPSQKAVKTYVDNQTPIYTNGAFSRAMNAATGSVTYAHGLGKVPKFIKITGLVGQNTNLLVSSGSYNGTSMACAYSNLASTPVQGNTTSAIVYLAIQSGQLQVATITWDATNFYLSWTYTTGGGASVTAELSWEAVA